MNLPPIYCFNFIPYRISNMNNSAEPCHTFIGSTGGKPESPSGWDEIRLTKVAALPTFRIFW